MIARCRVSWLAGTASTPSSTRTSGKTTSNSISRLSRSSGATMRVTERGASRFEGRALAASCKPATVLTLACAIARERCSTAICPRVRRRVCSVCELVFCHRHPLPRKRPQTGTPGVSLLSFESGRAGHDARQKSPFTFSNTNSVRRSRSTTPLALAAALSSGAREQSVQREVWTGTGVRASLKQSMTHRL